MLFRYLALALLAVVLVPGKSHALNVARMNALINTPTNSDQPLIESNPLSGHSGLSLDVDLSRGSSTSWTDRRSTSQEVTVLRYTIAFGAPDRPSRECDLSWQQIGKVAATGLVWSLSNRMIRGNGEAGDILPGGATLWGHAVPWMFAASLHRDLDYQQAAGHIAADVFSEQIAGWSAALDMGLSSELPVNHWGHNPGNRYEDQMAMTAHLYRAKSLSLAMLNNRYGEVDAMALASPVIGGAGYQAGRYLIEEGVTPGWGEDGLAADLFGSHAYHLGEITHGLAYGVGVARTVECH